MMEAGQMEKRGRGCTSDGPAYGVQVSGIRGGCADDPHPRARAQRSVRAG